MIDLKKYSDDVFLDTIYPNHLCKGRDCKFCRHHYDVTKLREAQLSIPLDKKICSHPANSIVERTMVSEKLGVEYYHYCMLCNTYLV